MKVEYFKIFFTVNGFKSKPVIRDGLTPEQAVLKFRRERAGVAIHVIKIKHIKPENVESELANV